MGSCEPIIDGVAGGVRPQFEGVPNALLARVRGPINVEHFLGAEVSSRSAAQYVTLSTGGATVTSAVVNPSNSDTVSSGIWRCTVDPDPASPQGIFRRQEVDTIAIDGFGSAWPTIWAARFRVNSAEPTVATYLCRPGGLFDIASTTATPTDGSYLFWDASLGTPSWVVRSRRGGANTDSVPLATFDNGFHTGGFLHTGAELIPFFDGDIFASVTGANIQPALAVTSRTHYLVTLIAGGVTASIDLDFVIWGR